MTIKEIIIFLVGLIIVGILVFLLYLLDERHLSIAYDMHREEDLEKRMILQEKLNGKLRARPATLRMLLAFVILGVILLTINTMGMPEMVSKILLIPLILILPIGNEVYLEIRERQVKSHAEQEKQKQKQSQHGSLLVEHQRCMKELEQAIQRYNHYFQKSGKQRHTKPAQEAARRKSELFSQLRNIEQRMLKADQPLPELTKEIKESSPLFNNHYRGRKYPDVK